MKLDKIKVYVLELFLVGILFFTLFASNIISRITLSIMMAVYVVIVRYLLKKRNGISMFEKQVTWLMVVCGLVYLAVLYLLGIYSGFVRTKIGFSWWSIVRYIIPTIVIIVSTEYIRKVFLSQDIYLKIKGKKFNLSRLLTYTSMVLVDLIIYTGIYNLSSMENFLTTIGFVLFASLSCNLLYDYIVNKYGSKGVIAYRLITIMYIYFIPIEPDIYVFFRSFLRMLYPYIIYLVLENSYSKRIKGSSKTKKRASIVSNTLLLTVTALAIMLISCQFRYGILVIGSESMTGTINKGDAVIFEKYKKQVIPNGQIIIFDYNGTQTVHRVVEIKNVNGERRYFTKGDSNTLNDDLYRLDSDISGLVHIKIKYLGYPTLWFRSLFE